MLLFWLVVWWQVVPRISSGPLRKLDVSPNCNKYWWTHILYINNFYPAEFTNQCMPWAWYLANDMQFAFFLPFIVLLFNKNKAAGWGVRPSCL
jgi:hypothetical protein